MVAVTSTQEFYSDGVRPIFTGGLFKKTVSENYIFTDGWQTTVSEKGRFLLVTNTGGTENANVNSSRTVTIDLLCISDRHRPHRPF